MSGFFATNTTNPPHWTLYYFFGAFCSILVHFGSFHNCIKLDAKHTELVQLIQKFMTRSHVGIFLDKRTQSTLVDSKLMFRSVSQYFSVFGIVCNCMKLVAKHTVQVQLMQKFVPRCHVKIFCNERTQSTPLDPKLMFRCV